MSKLIDKTKLNTFATKLWQKTDLSFVSKTKTNIITGKTILVDAYVPGVRIRTLNNPTAGDVMYNETSFFTSNSLTIPANTRVSQVYIVVDSNRRVGEIINGVNIGAIRKSDNRVLDYILRNGSGVVHENPIPNIISGPRVAVVDVNAEWNTDVYLTVGAKFALWGRRNSNFGGNAAGGNTLPSVGSTVNLTTSNWVGRVAVYGAEVPLTSFAPNNRKLIGELKTLAYDAGTETEIDNQKWLKCEGQQLNEAEYPELAEKLTDTRRESRSLINFLTRTSSNNITLPTHAGAGYLYICAKDIRVIIEDEVENGTGNNRIN